MAQAGETNLPRFDLLYFLRPQNKLMSLLNRDVEEAASSESLPKKDGYSRSSHEIFLDDLSWRIRPTGYPLRHQ